MFEGSGFPKLSVFCMVNDIHWMKEIDGTHFLMHRFTGQYIQISMVGIGMHGCISMSEVGQQ